MPTTAKHKRSTRARKKRVKAARSPSPSAASSATSSVSSESSEQPAENETLEAAASIDLRRSPTDVPVQNLPRDARTGRTVNAESNSAPNTSYQDGQLPATDGTTAVAQDGPTVQTSTSKLNQDFEAWYLTNVTDEFADDLDKLRQAADFKDSSVAVLRTSLKQGAELYSDEEKADILRGATVRIQANA